MLQNLSTLINGVGNFLFGIIFPDNCVVCSKPPNLICIECIWELKQSEPVLDMYACLSYQDKRVRKLLHYFKFKSRHTLAKDLAKILNENLLPIISDINSWEENQKIFIVPIPASKSGLKERGYDQGLLLAKFLSELSGYKVLNILDRRKDDTLHKKATRQEREDYAKNLFGLANLSNNNVSGSIVVLLDDIITTGSSMRSAQKTLLELKPLKIIPLAVAYQTKT